MSNDNPNQNVDPQDSLRDMIQIQPEEVFQDDLKAHTVENNEDLNEFYDNFILANREANDYKG
tara:strand:+ start:43 stop:231 length:189 start_codon:yes stop_codon:yes gene_type:complete